METSTIHKKNEKKHQHAHKRFESSSWSQWSVAHLLNLTLDREDWWQTGSRILRKWDNCSELGKLSVLKGGTFSLARLQLFFHMLECHFCPILHLPGARSLKFCNQWWLWECSTWPIWTHEDAHLLEMIKNFKRSFFTKISVYFWKWLILTGRTNYWPELEDVCVKRVDIDWGGLNVCKYFGTYFFEWTKTASLQKIEVLPKVYNSKRKVYKLCKAVKQLCGNYRLLKSL